MPTPRNATLRTLLIALIVTMTCLVPFITQPARAQKAAALTVDARKQPSPPQTGWLRMGTATDPSGKTLTVNSRYLELNGQPWLPVMGEFHSTRVPRDEWEPELLKLKAAGVEIVSFYVIWIHHEEIEGQWDWAGNKDIRAFTELCRKHGMYAVVRIGPWAHAEVRNGGLPDWVLKLGTPRSNDANYLRAVNVLYQQIGQQMRGLLWKDGGPVIGIQLENEYMLNGPGQGPGHIAKLKTMALAAGFDVPLYTVTGWDGAVYPPREVLPMFGGYEDWPWDSSTRRLAPNEMYSFRFESREGGDMGAPGGRPASLATQDALAPYPFLSAEYGAGTQDTYHRRPVIRADDVAAMLPAQIGSGVNLLGYYMFQGGQNPPGKLTTLQESLATGYPNDMQQKNYDFQAPLGEYGEERESYRKLKLFHYFLAQYGAQLAPMTTHAPEKIPSGPADFSVPRFAVRSLGDSGFLFLNNYLRSYKLPERVEFQARIRLPGGDLLVPAKPVTIPSGVYFTWPFNVSVAGVRMQYATAQPITTLHCADGDYAFFLAQAGIAPEFSLLLRDGQHVSGATTARNGTATLVHGSTGTGIAFSVNGMQGKTVHFIVIDQQQAERLTALTVAGHRVLAYSGAAVYSDGDAVHVLSAGRPDISIGLLGETETQWAAPSLKPAGEEGVFHVYTARLPARSIAVKLQQTRQPGTAPAIQKNNSFAWRKEGVAIAPTDEAINQAAGEWKLSISPEALDGVADVYLQIRYRGDVARLRSHDTLLDDDFFNGQPWVIGLKRYAEQIKDPLQLQIMPLRADAPIYLDDGMRPAIPSGQIATVESVTAVPEYEIVMHPAP